MGHFMEGDLNVYANQPSDTRDKQLEDCVIAHSAIFLNDEAATIYKRRPELPRHITSPPILGQSACVGGISLTSPFK